jgi:hypothetical protein
MFNTIPLSEPISETGTAIKQDIISVHSKQVNADGKSILNEKGTDLTLSNINCLSFDGSNDYIDSGVPLNTGTGNYTITGTFKLNSASSNKGLLDSKDANDDGIRILFDNSNNRMMFSHNTVDCNVAGAWDDGALHTFSMSKSFNTLTATIDSTTATADVSGQTISVTKNIELGRHAGGDYWDGILFNIKITHDTTYDTVVLHYPMQEGNGTKIYDVSGHGNHGTLSGGTWTTIDNVSSWNTLYGFSRNDIKTTFDNTNTDTSQITYTDVSTGSDNFPQFKRLTRTSSSGNNYLFFRKIGLTQERPVKVRYYVKYVNYQYLGLRTFYSVSNTMPVIDLINKKVHFDLDNSDVTIRDIGDGILEIEHTTIAPSSISDTSLGLLFANPTTGNEHVGVDAVPQNAAVDVCSVCFVDGAKIPLLDQETRQILTFSGGGLAQVGSASGLGASDFYYRFVFEPTWDNNNYLIVDGDANTNNRWFALQYTSTNRGINIVLDGDGTKTTETIFNHTSKTFTDGDKILMEIKRVGAVITVNAYNMNESVKYTFTYTNTFPSDGTSTTRDFSGGNNLTFGAHWTGSASFQSTTVGWIHAEMGTSETNLTRKYDFDTGVGTDFFYDSVGGTTATITGTKSWERRTPVSALGATNDTTGLTEHTFTGRIVSADYELGNPYASNPSTCFNNSECTVTLPSGAVETGELSKVVNETSTRLFVAKTSNNSIKEIIEASEEVSDSTKKLISNQLIRSQDIVPLDFIGVAGCGNIIQDSVKGSIINGLYELSTDKSIMNSTAQNLADAVDYFYNNIENTQYCIVKDGADKKWRIIHTNGSVQYAEVTAGDTVMPPRDGYEVGSSNAPLPTILKKTVMTTADILPDDGTSSIDGYDITSYDPEQDLVILTSTDDVSGARIMFGEFPVELTTLGTPYVVGHKVFSTDSGTPNCNAQLGAVDKTVFGGFRINGNLTAFGGDGFSQISGKKHDGTDYTPATGTHSGFQLAFYDDFATGTQIYIKNFRMLV